MLFESWRSVPALTAVFLATTFNVPQPLLAQSAGHVVSPSDLQKAVTDASQSRQQNLDTLRGFLSSDQARQAIESAHMKPQQVTSAVAGLNDEELAQLASRASKAQSDFAAGSIGNHDLLLILVLLAALILIIVAVR